LAAEAHPRGNRGPPGDRRGLSKGGGCRGQATARLGPSAAGKAGQRDVLRLADFKTGNEVSPDPGLVAVPSRSPTASACEPYLDFIEISLSKGRNAKSIYQDLVDDHGFTGRYQSVKRFVRQLRGRPGPQACAIIVTPPGEEAQVDYGTGPMVRDPHSGLYRRTRMFVLTLGYSRIQAMPANSICPQHPMNQRGSVLMIRSPLGIDAAYRLGQSGERAESASYIECLPEHVLSELQARGMSLVISSVRSEPYLSWQSVFESLRIADARPCLIVGVASIGKGMWNDVFRFARGDIYVLPADLEDLAQLVVSDPC